MREQLERPGELRDEGAVRGTCGGTTGGAPRRVGSSWRLLPIDVRCPQVGLLLLRPCGGALRGGWAARSVELWPEAGVRARSSRSDERTWMAGARRRSGWRQEPGRRGGPGGARNAPRQDCQQLLRVNSAGRGSGLESAVEVANPRSLLVSYLPPSSPPRNGRPAPRGG